MQILVILNQLMNILLNTFDFPGKQVATIVHHPLQMLN
jgi:hypothetical protein